ncbi:hypothetical protein AMTRI_Chr02g261390 [Amborella trichopoda]
MTHSYHFYVKNPPSPFSTSLPLFTTCSLPRKIFPTTLSTVSLSDSGFFGDIFRTKMAKSVILTLKVLFLSMAVVSTAIFLKFSLPVLMEFMAYEVPILCDQIKGWLTPPYLYIVINCIIITIAASSSFQQKPEENNQEPLLDQKRAEIRNDYGIPAIHSPEFEIPTEIKRPSFEITATKKSSNEEEEDFLSRGEWWPTGRSFPMVDSLENSCVTEEKPPVSVRFSHRKSVKASPEGGRAGLGVARPKRHETLESTWKTITDGRAIPLARHLKKSDTWETHGRSRMNDSSSPLMKKSDTFDERRSLAGESTPSPGSCKGLRKDPSLSQDELNRRVEAFIKKFNAEIRLQRKQSFQTYMDMVNPTTNN